MECPDKSGLICHLLPLGMDRDTGDLRQQIVRACPIHTPTHTQNNNSSAIHLFSDAQLLVKTIYLPL